MKNFTFIFILVSYINVLTGCCENIVYDDIPNERLRQSKIECLRTNNINFAINDQQEIVIIGSNKDKLKEITEKSWHDFKGNHKDGCFPNKVHSK